ncbi:protocadherin-9-like isoform X2 [Gigantopelta aegis]|uniref:protocadherin-9-like isoform X2 n=1 Tax=Gigantopelta aegis TaxID=1735272 RepID=UPI001B88A2EF|nr:protocadherin-9-like isoform X2 [Gigantopelta aegis]
MEITSFMFKFLLPFAVLCLIEANRLAYQIKEEERAGLRVGNVAIDSLLQGNLSATESKNMKYVFFSQGNPFSHLFLIDEKDSTITTAQKIDRESVCHSRLECVLNLDIAIYKKDLMRNVYDLFQLMQAKVTLIDINDNPPAFPQSTVSLSVPESVPLNHMLLASGAVDSDTEPFSIQTYKISPQTGMFGLKEQRNLDGSSDLAIVVKHSLDRETKDFFQVVVTAIDGGNPPKSGSVLINITVTDVNDNEPAFLKSVYNVSIYENRPINSTILQVSAVDQDLDQNGEVSFQFSSRLVPKAFGIDPKTGNIYAKGEIDYESNEQFQLIVKAHDHGTPELSSFATVIINVLDENDNAPQININLSPEGTDISEGVEIGKFIAHVSVSDADTGLNGAIMCEMSDSHFALQQFYNNVFNIFKITLNKSLDHERFPTHNVTVKCRDNGKIPKWNSTSFTVTVLDENDNSPEFSRAMFTGSIQENNDIGEEILQVVANDWDSLENGRVSYSLASDAGSMFVINPGSGVIKAKSPFDREKTSQYNFHVIATDHGVPAKTSTAEVVVSILDQNDQPPFFTKPVFLFYVLENQPSGTPVGNLTFTDADLGKASKNVFSFLPNTDAEYYFSLDPRTGQIKTQREFDRELQSKFNFSVHVQDPFVPNFYDTSKVSVQILDDNDNIPKIIFPSATNNSVRVVYNQKVGSIIATVRAEDTDDILQRRLFFFIKQGNTQGLFNINRMTGDLAISRLMRLSDIKTHSLILAVQDSGRSAKMVEAKLDIVIFTNGTYGDVDGQHGLDQNMLIVIILIAVTVILAIAIVATIFMIRRIDRERHGQVVVSKTVEGNCVPVSASCETNRLSTVSKDSNGNDGLSKKNRKEVSFSLEDDKDTHNSSNSSGHASMSTFGSGGAEHSVKNSNGVGLVIGNSSAVAVSSQNDINSPQAVTNSHTSIPVHNIPLHPPTDKHWIQNINQEEAKHLMELLKKPDDVISESSGETGTSDSGRGGSDDDINNSRPISHDTAKKTPVSSSPCSPVSIKQWYV